MQQQAVEYIKNATITGNVTNDPRMGEGGWVSFTIAHTPRHLDIAASLKFATAQIIPNPKKTYDVETVQPSPYQG